MIRKPDSRDFRESNAVVAIRDAGTIAVEGARGVKDGTASFIGRAFALLMGFGFLMSVIGHLGPVALLIVGGAGLTWLLTRMQARTKRAAHDRAVRWGDQSAPPVRAPAAVIEPVRIELSVGAAARTAATIAVPAILFFPTSGMLTFMMPFTFGAIVALAAAFLIVARLFGDRTLLHYDAETLTVKGLLGEATILWADVGDITVRKAAWYDLRVRFTSGSRRNLVVLGRVNRLGGPDTLYIPIDLLGLDKPALARLVTRLLALTAGAPIVDALAAERASPRPAPGLAPLPGPAPTGFDPDEIIARYIAERDQLVATQRPDIAPPRRATFGRKVA